MYGGLPKYNELLVISDTQLFEKDGQTYGFGPVVKELEVMLYLFKKITWIGFNHQEKYQNNSFLPIPSERIIVKSLDPVGGNTISDKVIILKKYPDMWRMIHSQIKKHSFIHCRAPSNPAFIAMYLSKKYPTKQFWFKYAGNWIERAPLSYSLQRNLLKKRSKNSIITVNGKWDNQPSNILAFENPCLTRKDREEGTKTVQNKHYSAHKKYCFIGGLNINKGILLFLDALKEMVAPNEFSEIHIVGGGPLKEVVHSKIAALNYNIVLHGSLPKENIYKIYKKCHFLILPSKSEGFPKVVGEAMNFGCIPIVSDISCINQYIDNTNGFLLKPISKIEIKKVLEESFRMTEEKFKTIIKLNYRLADKFTYSHYLERIQNDIFKNS